MRLRVHAAGVHIDDWQLMTGEPRLMRIMGFGFRVSGPCQGHAVAGRHLWSA